MRHVNRGVATAVLAISLVAGSVACSSDGADVQGAGSEDFGGVTVAAEEARSGVDTARLMLTAAPVVVVAAADRAAQARAASAAVGLRAPMLTEVPEGTRTWPKRCRGSVPSGCCGWVR